MKILKVVSLSAAALALLSSPALARDGHHWHGGSRISFGFGIAAPVYYGPSYYRPAYYGPAYYGPSYYEPVVVAPRPVVVGRAVRGDVAVDVQRALGRKGYYCGVVDGDLGPQSRAAIRAWQADVGLTVTGTINPATLRSLGLL
jgi:hypothetical protein